MEIYSELIKDYDKKLKQIIIENNDLKTLIFTLLGELDLVIQNSVQKKSENFYNNDYHKLINSPFDEIFQNLNDEIQSKIKFLKTISKNNCDSLITADNITISSISSNLSDVFNKTLNNSDNVVYDKSENKTQLDFDQSTLILNNASISSSSFSSSTSTESRRFKK